MTELPDRLLRDVLRDTSATPSPACVDADALAAWADGTLSRAERAAFDAHAAACVRCQTLMATMARLEPPPAEPVWWRRSPFAWLLPLATVAVVVIAVGVATIARQPSFSAARVPSQPGPADRQAAAPAIAPPPVGAGETHGAGSSPSTPAPRAPEPGTARRAFDTPSSGTMASRAKTSTAAPQAATPARPSAAPSSSAAAAATPSSGFAASSRPAPPPSPPPAMAAPASPPPPPTSAAAAAASPLLAPPSAASSAVPSTPPSAPRDEASGAQLARAAPSSMARETSAQAPLVIASPDPDSQWRIVGGAVEHTANGGQTWQPQAPGIGAPIRAGAAPTARICWVAGVRGVVLRTTDGSTWVRIEFPEPVDLVAVQASDALHATVTTAAGRTFRTGDGGKSWTAQ